MLSPRGPLGNNGAPESGSDLSLILKAKKSKQFRNSLAVVMKLRIGWISGGAGGLSGPRQTEELQAIARMSWGPRGKPAPDLALLPTICR